MKKTIYILLLGLFFAPQNLMAQNWWNDAVVYELFVRSFHDSNGDEYGDFKGIQMKLGYLEELGVDALWLMPIFKSPAWHGYTSSDYYEINPEYGTLAEFETLITEAEKYNIRIIMDLMVNHCSSEHEWFQKSIQRDSIYDTWFKWYPELPGEEWITHIDQAPVINGGFHWNEEREEYFYAYFGDRAPDLNFENPEVRQEMIRIAKFWLDKGVAGFRLDAAQNIIEEGPGEGLQYDSPGTIDWWIEFSDSIKAEYPEAFLIGEVWSEYKDLDRYYANGRGLDACFDFPLEFKIAELLTGEATVEDFKALVREKYAASTPTSFYAPFLSNHDQERYLSVLGRDFEKARQAVVLSMTTNGTPFLFFGEEVGAISEPGVLTVKPMAWNDAPNAGYTYADSAWTATGLIEHPHNLDYQKNTEGSLWQHYQKMIALRKEQPEFRSGACSFFEENQDLLIYEKRLDDQVSIIVMNTSEQDQRVLTKDLFGRHYCLLSEKNIWLRKRKKIKPGAVMILQLKQRIP